MKRGSNVALTREIPTLTSVVLGVRLTTGSDKTLTDNLVMVTILCDEASRVLSDEHIVFFNQLSSPEESVSQREQALGGDLEQVEVDLADVPVEVKRLVVVLYLNEGVVQNRSLGRLRECSIRVLDAHGDTELVRSENLAPGLTTENALALGELYRHQEGWKFKVLGAGYAGGIAAVAADYGVTL